MWTYGTSDDSVELANIGKRLMLDYLLRNELISEDDHKRLEEKFGVVAFRANFIGKVFKTLKGSKAETDEIENEEGKVTSTFVLVELT